MTHNHSVILGTLFIALFCMGLQCDKDDIAYKYNFIESVNLFPEKKSYTIGDTIWVQYTNPNKKLFDKLTSQYIDVDTVSIHFQISFNFRYNAPIDPADGFCDFITPNGLNNGRYLGIYGTGMSATFGCNNSSYDFKIGIVPKHKGIYSIDLPHELRSVSPCSTRIGAFPFSGIEYRFNVTDGNKDVYLTIPPNSRSESTRGYTENKIDNKQVFVVQVD